MFDKISNCFFFNNKIKNLVFYIYIVRLIFLSTTWMFVFKIRQFAVININKISLSTIKNYHSTKIIKTFSHLSKFYVEM